MEKKKRFSELSREETQFLLNLLNKPFYKEEKEISKDLREHLETFNKGTLRNYIHARTQEALHNFKFQLGSNWVNVKDVNDFCKYFKEELLDQYRVLEVEEVVFSDRPSDYYLAIERIKKEELEK